MKENLFIGVMSGTSMDGLDVAACRFDGNGFEIVRADTFPFPSQLILKLKNAYNSAAPEIAILDAELGFFIGESVKKFLKSNGAGIKPTAIASHGHTVIHDPANGYTLQIGSGAHMSQASGLPCVVDFRSNDVAAGGQGAPLVPIGDLHLFSEYQICLNLGGIANISAKSADGKSIIGFDICGCNLILNELALIKGKPFDKNGMLAKKGKVCQPLLMKLLQDSQVSDGSFSLDAKEAKQTFFNESKKHQLSLEDQMATAVEFVACSVSKTIKHLTSGEAKESNCLVSGGGAHNLFLVERIKEMAPCKIIIPDPMLVDYKEALIFAYMGWLRWQNKPNCLASVTGATKDTVGGAVYLP